MSTGAPADKCWAGALKVSTHPRSEFPQPLLLLLRLPQWRRGFNPWVRKIPWRGAWQPTPVSLLGKSRGQRSLVGYSPRGHKESDTTEATEQARLHVPLVSPPSPTTPLNQGRIRNPTEPSVIWMQRVCIVRTSLSVQRKPLSDRGQRKGDAGAPTDLLKWPGRSALNWQTDAQGPGGLCQEEKRARRNFWGLEAQTAPCSSSIQMSKTNRLTQGPTRAQARGFPAGPSALSGHLLEARHRARCSGEYVSAHNCQASLPLPLHI